MNRQKTILIPTDFCVASLNPLRLALEQTPEPAVNVVLLHSRMLDDSITELLFYSPARIIHDLLTDDFREALSMLRNRFGNKFGLLRIELFHGYAQCTFDMLSDTLKIDAIYFSKSYKQQLTQRAFDATPYIIKGVIPYYDVDELWQETTVEKYRLENLFLT